jgi:acid phosphatase type 7
MYNSENYTADYDVTLHIRSSLEPLTDKYKVDLVLAGHYHSYERTCKVLNEVCYSDMKDPSGKCRVG